MEELTANLEAALARELGFPAEDSLREELHLQLEVAGDRRNDELVRGLANVRLLQLLRRGAETDVPVAEIAALTDQSDRQLYRRAQLARALARFPDPEVEELVRLRRIGITDALDLIELHRTGHDVRPSQLRALRRAKAPRLTPAEQARLEGFVTGARWAHRALLSELPHEDWLAQLAHDWQESRRT